MKSLRLLLLLSALASCAAYAQPDSEPIPDFTNLDEFIYEPKTTLSLGIRSLGGGKISFRGQGTIASPDNAGNATDTNISRVYHDGAVGPDIRATLELNSDGTIKYDADGNFTLVPVPADGKTNQWRFIDDTQATDSPGFIAMHTYSAEITDTRARQKDADASMGVELAVARDMGKIFGSRFSWQLAAGMSVNDINAVSKDTVQANLTTMTDLYSLDGVAAPAAPYSAPPPTVDNVLDADGNPVLDIHGNEQLVVTNTAILLGNSPVSRSFSTTSDNTTVNQRSKLRGAYYTVRVGPTVWMPISNRFRIGIGFGAMVIYAGTNYTVVHTFQPELGGEITDTLDENDSGLIPGYYADATLQFDVTSRTGFYAGAVFQSSGDYDHTIATGANTSYVSKLEFGNQHGFRAGMTIKF